MIRNRYPGLVIKVTYDILKGKKIPLSRLQEWKWSCKRTLAKTQVLVPARRPFDKHTHNAPAEEEKAGAENEHY
jgi:hypothetical protein